MNIPLDFVAVEMLKLGMASLICCAVINKFDKMTEPNYVRPAKGLSKIASHKRTGR